MGSPLPVPAGLRPWTADCHCGQVRFRVLLDLAQPTFRCNCTLCRRTRFWGATGDPASLEMLTAPESLTEYRCGSESIRQYFCSRCGVRTHGVVHEDGRPTLVAVNVGCLAELDDAALASLPIERLDGLQDRFDHPPAHAAHL